METKKHYAAWISGVVHLSGAMQNQKKILPKETDRPQIQQSNINITSGIDPHSVRFLSSVLIVAMTDFTIITVK
jgi:hypothetical protein